MRRRTVLTYASVVVVPLVAMGCVLYAGRSFAVSAPAESPGQSIHPAESVAPFNLALMVLQIFVILGTARLAGWLFHRIGQPRVIGEMAAGLVLGPSLLGFVAPGVMTSIFPSGSLGYLNAVSQLGLVLFMFLVGVDLDLGVLKRLRTTAIVVGHASIAVPFALGAGLSLTLYSTLAPPGMSFVGFALFVGAAMSVTAFPVLARILMERGLVRTELGVVAIASAAVSDVTAWAILAGIVALLRSSAEVIPLWVTICGSVLWTVIVLWVARPMMRTWDTRFSSMAGYEARLVSLCILFALVSAFVTQMLGVHALFGAFLAGAAVPRRAEVGKLLRHRIETTTVVVLLPVFFALTGLKTSVGLLATGGRWIDCALVTLVAIVGKLGGSGIAARGSGMSLRDSVSLGVLMNTRGLMELIILSIGLELGIITPTLFAMMVLMALVTTFMTSPLLSMLGYHGAEASHEDPTDEPAMT